MLFGLQNSLHMVRLLLDLSYHREAEEKKESAAGFKGNQSLCFAWSIIMREAFL